jgi:hypothetical protein
VITVSNILFDLARSLENGVPQPGDTDIDLASTIVPIIKIPAPMDGPSTLNTTPLRSSVVAGTFISVVAGVGAGTVTLLMLTKGLWRFNLEMSLATNYALFGAQCTLALVYPVGQATLLGMTVGGAAAAPVVQNAQKTVEVLIPKNGVTLVSVASNNAAGQSMTGYAGVLASKLL